MNEGLVFRRTLAEVNLERILYVRPTMTIAEAATRLAEGYGALVVTGPLGAVTEKDIARAIARGAALDRPVEEIVLSRLFLVAQDESLESGLRSLLDHPDRCVIVVDAAHDGIGRLTVAEVVKTLSSGSPWLHALQLALEPNEATLIAVEL
jgi:predicted transcriptional regulator